MRQTSQRLTPANPNYPHFKILCPIQKYNWAFVFQPPKQPFNVHYRKMTFETEAYFVKVQQKTSFKLVQANHTQ